MPGHPLPAWATRNPLPGTALTLAKRCLLVLAAVPLMTCLAGAADVPGWTEHAAPGPGRVLACVGQGCTNDTLRCTLSPEKRLPNGTVEGLADPMVLPSGQMAYLIAADLIRDRPDLFGTGDKASDGTDSYAYTPVLLRMAGRPVLLSNSVASVSGRRFVVVHALWSRQGLMASLLCAGVAEDGSTDRALGLLATLVAE